MRDGRSGRSDRQWAMGGGQSKQIETTAALVRFAHLPRSPAVRAATAGGCVFITVWIERAEAVGHDQSLCGLVSCVVPECLVQPMQSRVWSMQLVCITNVLVHNWLLYPAVPIRHRTYEL